MHEEVSLTSLGELKERYGDEEAKGEIVLVVEGAAAPEPKNDPGAIVDRVDELLEEGLDEKDALRTVAKEVGLPKREIYRIFKLD